MCYPLGHNGYNLIGKTICNLSVTQKSNLTDVVPNKSPSLFIVSSNSLHSVCFMNTDVSANASKETCSGNDKDNYKILLPSSPELSDIIMTS